MLFLVASLGLFLVRGKTLYRCFYGIIDVENQKRSGMYNVLSDCFALGIFSIFYLYPFNKGIGAVWYIIAFIIDFAFFYLLCHITYAQYLKANEEDFNPKKKVYSQTIGIICGILFVIFLTGPAINWTLNKDRAIVTLSQEEVGALEDIQQKMHIIIWIPIN